MTALLDVNVLVALAWPNHVHHQAAWDWFDSVGEQGWATCPVTEGGFVRISCLPSTTQHSITPLDALAGLAELVTQGSHTFWPLDRSILDLPDLIMARLQGYRQVTDAILLATAVQHGGQLATFDTRLQQLLPGAEHSYVTLIPA